MLWSIALLAGMFAVGSLALGRRVGVRTVGIVALATVVFAQPALATFTATDAPVSPLNAANIAASTGLSCAFTSGTATQLSWTATATTWADNNYVNRNSNGGAYSEVGNTGARATVTYNDSSLTPDSVAYTWTVKAGKNNWRGDASSSLAANACSGIATVSTIAMPGTAAEVQDPQGLAFDSSGNLYIADTGNHRIRKVDTSGQMTTVAGNGTSGNNGDGGAATSANLASPEGVAVASNGDIYIADTGNNRIRKVSGGNISNFSGDSGGTSGSTDSPAKFNAPAGIVVASSGDLYVSDRGNNKLRKVTSAGVPSTAYSTLSAPEGIALDSATNSQYVYIADAGNHKIIKFQISNSTASTVTGTGSSGFTNDGSAGNSGTAKVSAPDAVAVDSSSNVYIADTGNKRIRKVTVSTSTIDTVAGTGSIGYTGEGYPATSSAINAPKGVAVDASDIAYLSDTTNDIVRKITSHSNLVGVAGNNTGGFLDGTAATAALVKPHGMATDSSGNVIIADESDHRIRKWWADTGEVATIAGSGASGSTGDGASAIAAKLAAPEGVAVAANGDIYVADTGNNRIRKFTIGGNISNFAGNSSGNACIAGSLPCGDGGSPTVAAAKLNMPDDIVFDSAGALYISDRDDHSIRKVSGGTLSTYAGLNLTSGSTDNATGTSARFDHPLGLAIDASDNIYVADWFNSSIRKISPSGTNAVTTVVAKSLGQSTTCGGASGANASTGILLSSPMAVATVGNDVYIADNGRHRICRLSGTAVYAFMGTGSSGTAGDGGTAGSAAIQQPAGLAYSATTGLFVAHNLTNGRVRRVVAPLVVL